jgi:hypothetical protein
MFGLQLEPATLRRKNHQQTKRLRALRNQSKKGDFQGRLSKLIGFALKEEKLTTLSSSSSSSMWWVLPRKVCFLVLLLLLLLLLLLQNPSSSRLSIIFSLEALLIFSPTTTDLFLSSINSFDNDDDDRPARDEEPGWCSAESQKTLLGAFGRKQQNTLFRSEKRKKKTHPEFQKKWLPFQLEQLEDEVREEEAGMQAREHAESQLLLLGHSHRPCKFR